MEGGEGKKLRKEGRTERRREPEDNGKWRKWKERGNRLGEKLVWSKQQSTDQIDGTYTLLAVMVKSEIEEKEAKEGEKYRHCSSSMVRNIVIVPVP